MPCSVHIHRKLEWETALAILNLGWKTSQNSHRKSKHLRPRRTYCVYTTGSHLTMVFAPFFQGNWPNFATRQQSSQQKVSVHIFPTLNNGGTMEFSRNLAWSRWNPGTVPRPCPKLRRPCPILFELFQNTSRPCSTVWLKPRKISSKPFVKCRSKLFVGILLKMQEILRNFIGILKSC